ncbi:MAG: branched-chain amino acid aminotransferase [Parachlamydia sp.]|nr:MAG: branched-chain amino acid aminotransferase [Parachlamydia sp.]
MTTQSSLMPFAYFRKEIVPSHQASISIASHSLQYGTTCFGGIRGYFRGGKIRIFRLEDHYFRLKQAAKILGMQVKLSWEDFHEIITGLIRKNAPQSDFYIRPFLFSENQVLTPRFDGLDFDLAIYVAPLNHYFDPHRGLRLMVSSWRKISDTAMSTKAKAGGCYVNSALATSEAKRCGYDEALMMDEQGNIVEASVANIFVVYRGEVIMPEVGASMLEGITRRTVIDFLQEEGIAIRSERIDRSMIYTCDELILTGTAAQVMYGHSVDGRVIGQEDVPGPICQRLRQKFTDVIAKTHPKSSNWITEFHPY